MGAEAEALIDRVLRDDDSTGPPATLLDVVAPAHLRRGPRAAGPGAVAPHAGVRRREGCLYVMNDLAHDARAICEARSLAAGGDDVTATTTTSDRPNGRASTSQPRLLRPDPDRCTASLAAVVRRPRPSVAARPPRCLGAPLDPRRRRASSRRWRTRRRPWCSCSWIAVLGAWTFVARVILRRPWHPGVLDDLLRWRSFHLGWAARRSTRPLSRTSTTRTTWTPVGRPGRRPARRRAGRRRQPTRSTWEFEHRRASTSLAPLGDATVERNMARHAAALITINGVCATSWSGVPPRRVVVVHSCSPRSTPPAKPRTGSVGRPRPQRGTIALCHGGSGRAAASRRRRPPSPRPAGSPPISLSRSRERRRCRRARDVPGSCRRRCPSRLSRRTRSCPGWLVRRRRDGPAAGRLNHVASTLNSCSRASLPACRSSRATSRPLQRSSPATRMDRWSSRATRWTPRRLRRRSRGSSDRAPRRGQTSVGGSSRRRTSAGPGRPRRSSSSTLRVARSTPTTRIEAAYARHASPLAWTASA